MSDDRYAGFDYSRLIAWDERLKREWPLFEELLRGAPSKRVLDLGSGTGEHAPASIRHRRCSRRAAQERMPASGFSPAICARSPRSSKASSVRPFVLATPSRT
jgi:hypothetical protein